MKARLKKKQKKKKRSQIINMEDILVKEDVLPHSIIALIISSYHNGGSNRVNRVYNKILKYPHNSFKHPLETGRVRHLSFKKLKRIYNDDKESNK